MSDVAPLTAEQLGDCPHCHKPLGEWNWRSGRSYTTDPGRVHVWCLDAYNEINDTKADEKNRANNRRLFANWQRMERHYEETGRWP